MPFEHQFVVTDVNEFRLEVAYTVERRVPFVLPENTLKDDEERLKLEALTKVQQQLREQVKKELGLTEIQKEVKPSATK